MNYGNFVAMTSCFLCGEGKDILLHRRLRDISEVHNKVVDTEPCSKCQEYMKQGVILIEVDESKTSDKKNPWRAGGWCVVKEEAVKRMGITPPELEADILKRRVCFLPTDVWDMFGLPRGEKQEV